MEHLHPQLAHMAHTLIAHTAAEFWSEINRPTIVKKKTRLKKGTKGMEGWLVKGHHYLLYEAQTLINCD